MNETKQNTHEAAPSQQPAARVYRGKEVLTQDTCDYSTVQIGDYVEQAVVDAACFQMGEPYSHREDPDTGKWRATYATFKRCLDASGVWEYCGHCFQGETLERGKDPVYC